MLTKEERYLILSKVRLGEKENNGRFPGNKFYSVDDGYVTVLGTFIAFFTHGARRLKGSNDWDWYWEDGTWWPYEAVFSKQNDQTGDSILAYLAEGYP